MVASLKKFKVYIPLIVEIGYREIEVPEEVLKKWESMQKSQSKEKQKKRRENT